MFFFGCLASQLHAQTSAVLTWEASPSIDVAGYHLYYGTATGLYDSQIEGGTNLIAAVSNLALGRTYYFAASAYDSQGGESIPSNEVALSIPPAIQTNIINELSTLTLTNLTNNLSLPAGSLSFSLSNAPPGAMIDPASGVFTWTPSDTQSAGTYVITVLVTVVPVLDPPLTVSLTFVVLVNHPSFPLVLPLQINRILTNQENLVVTNTAMDNALSGKPLTYRLLTSPTGAAIDTNGIITWSPSSGQRPSTNIFVTMVTDFSAAAATNAFTVVATSNNPSSTSSPPQLKITTDLSGILKITWDSTTDQAYQVQFTSEPSIGVWVNLGNVVIATNETTAISDLPGASPARFYRILVLP